MESHASSISRRSPLDCLSMARFCETIIYNWFQNRRDRSKRKQYVSVPNNAESEMETANVVLEGACERVIVGEIYYDISLGLYMIGGENVILNGELDLEKEEILEHMTVYRLNR